MFGLSVLAVSDTGDGNADFCGIHADGYPEFGGRDYVVSTDFRLYVCVLLVLLNEFARIPNSVVVA